MNKTMYLIIDTTNTSRGWQAELYNEDDKLLSWATESDKDIAVIHATLLFIKKCPEHKEQAIERMIMKLKEK